MHKIKLSDDQVKYLMAVLGQRPLQECYELYRALEKLKNKSINKNENNNE